MGHIRSLFLLNDLLISYIAFKWHPFENLKWTVNMIDRKDWMNAKLGKLKVKLSQKIPL